MPSPVYGHAKQGTSYGHTKIAGKQVLHKGLSPRCRRRHGASPGASCLGAWSCWVFIASSTAASQGVEV